MGRRPHFLRLGRVRDAVVVARPVLDDWSGGAGVLRRVDGDLRYVKESGLRRGGRDQIPAPATSGWDVREHERAAVYAGFLYDHYGHFLLESLARLWAPAPRPAVPVVWIAAWTDTFSPWMTDILDLLGVHPDRRIVTAASGALEVGNLLMPDPGFEFGEFVHPWFARRLARHEVPPTHRSEGTHVWLSRSDRAPTSGLDEEPRLEARLRREGWTIVRPGSLPITEQVATLASACHVAGLEGSAFHTLALLRDHHAAVDLFTRQHHPNFELLAAASGIDQTRHRLPGATPRERRKTRGTDVQWSGVDIDAVVELLHTRCATHGHPPPRSAAA